jgi:hypothetical protein
VSEGLTAEQIVELRAKVHRLVFHRRADVEPDEVAALHALDGELDRLVHESTDLILRAAAAIRETAEAVDESTRRIEETTKLNARLSASYKLATVVMEATTRLHKAEAPRGHGLGKARWPPCLASAECVWCVQADAVRMFKGLSEPEFELLVIVHALRGGRALCELDGLPNEWPPGNLWARVDDFRVTRIPSTCAWCDDCGEALVR